MLMLRELSIRQFAIIEEIHLHFGQGFHVLTGETGAGKSILIDALALIVGGRASSDFVRYGSEKAEIEAVFDISTQQTIHFTLQEWGIEEEDLLIIRREITAYGKNTCRINGRIVTLAMLHQIGNKLLDISGQGEHQSLFHVEEHVEWLDQFAGASILPVRRDYEQIYHQVEQLKKEWTERHEHQVERARHIDWLQFQQEEIQSAQLVVGEDEELEQARNRFVHMEKLLTHSTQAYAFLYGEQGGLHQIQAALSHLQEITALDDSFAATQEMAQSAYYPLEEASRELARYRDGLEFDADRFAQIEERLHLIKQLKRKYGETLAQIIAFAKKVTTELEKMRAHEESKVGLAEKLKELQQQLAAKASQLTHLRKQAAKHLEYKIERELSDLHMKGTLFRVSFSPLSKEAERFSIRGQEEVAFQIAPNPGEPLRPLTKIASGGEASRIMFALKVIFTGIEQFHTLVFDEIDAGVSGRAAQAIAEKMAFLSTNHQIVCITHLPQVACMADQHFYICKETDANKTTRTQVKLLVQQERTLELARLLGGVEVTQKTCEHAEEMIRLANEVKQHLQRI
jgi:DNA repair protein RecN (Recombination protein N)